MRKIVISLIFLLGSLVMNAQLIVDCASHRFDQEVFSSVNVTSNIIYGVNLDVNGAVDSLAMDVYEPAGDTMQHRPVIVWAHGGSFIAGNKTATDVVSLSQHFAKRGYVCVSIDYRLGLGFPINQESATKAVYRSMQDMKAAIRFLRKDAAANDVLKIDPHTIFAGGTSAGAFTALHIAYLDSYAELATQIDTAVMGDLEGNTGSRGFSSEVNAVIDLCGALGDKTFMKPNDIPFCAMHGNHDNTVPYATATIYFLSSIPVMVVDGSFSIAEYANSIGLYNQMYTFYGADHVPFVTSVAYMDTTVRFVSNFLYRYLNCTPSDPSPNANTFTTAISSFSAQENIQVYPNPGSGNFTFDFPETNGENQLSIFDIIGKKVAEFNHLANTSSFNMSYLNPGTYFYSVNSGKKIYKGRFLKNN